VADSVGAYGVGERLRSTLNPIPWLVAGLVLVVVGVIAQTRRLR
jgi:hypothetical protein